MRLAVQTLGPYLWRYRRSLALGVGALVIKVLMSASLPLLIRAGVDSLAQGFRLEKVFEFAGLLIVFSALKGVFQYWMRVVLIGMSRDVEFDLRNDLYHRLLTLSPDFYGRFRTGDIMARATNDLNAVRMMLGPGVMYWTETMLTFALAIAVMGSVNWQLTLLVLMPAPVVSIVVIRFGRAIHAQFESIQRMFSDISSRVQENLAGMRVVRAYTQENAELAEFEQLNQGYIRANLRLALSSGLFNPLLQALIGLTFLLVLWFGGQRLLTRQISLGSFVMFNTYMGTLIWPMIALGWVVNLMQRGTASLQRIHELLGEQPTIAAPKNATAVPTALRGEIAFHEVGVRYGTQDALVDVNLRVEAGSTVAIVGHTGSGKSTLVQLVPRLLDPTRGAVLIDGVDVRQFDPEELRAQIGFVPQETFLFSATLADNIALGVKDATPDEIRQAAELAGLGPDLATFADGLQTVIGERGITLSGGQKQRTAIARAILRNPRILILDDALSSVDTLTEERILNGLAGMMAGRTTILISHRVSTVRNADLIVVLEHGTIVEQGSHASLLRQGGYYADLYQKQLLEEELQEI